MLDLPNGMTFDLTHQQFARDWALGQFYFHVMAAYAILRKEGVRSASAITCRTCLGICGRRRWGELARE